MNLNAEQQNIVNAKNHCLVLGSAGTGKTTALAERVVALVNQGEKPEGIFLAAFSLRSMLFLRKILIERLGKETASRVRIGTLRDFALAAMKRAPEPLPELASFVEVRRKMGLAMNQVGFKGSIIEADHVIRQFKARARRPQENERFYDLLITLKNMMEAAGKIDRYDLLRQHIVGMANSSYKPCPMRHLLVDNIQDATEIQIFWLVEHVKAGAVLVAAGDPDQCVFALDGAVAEKAMPMLEDALEGEQISKVTLAINYRNPRGIAEGAESLLSAFTETNQQRIRYQNQLKTDVRFQKFERVEEEYSWIRAALKKLMSQNAQLKVGILTRTERQALRMSHALGVHNLPHTCLATGIWDTPGAIMVLDMLEVLLNTAKDDQLRNVLIGAGLSITLVDNLFSNGMHAQDWLPSGAQAPQEVELPVASQQEYGNLQRRWVGYYSIMKEKQLSGREVFKAAAYDLLQSMSADDRHDGLMAVEALVALKGHLVDILPTLRQRKLPDMNNQVIVAPIREVRNQEFDIVFMPFAKEGNYPYLGLNVLGLDDLHERRVTYMGLTRAKRSVVITTSGETSAYMTSFMTTLQQGG